jgi:hypothetical protein
MKIFRTVISLAWLGSAIAMFMAIASGEVASDLVVAFCPELGGTLRIYTMWFMYFGFNAALAACLYYAYAAYPFKRKVTHMEHIIYRNFFYEDTAWVKRVLNQIMVRP